MEQTKGIFLLIGAQQNTYRARNGSGTCWIMSAKNLKSSVLHIKYIESSTVLRDMKISWKKEQLAFLNYHKDSQLTIKLLRVAFGRW